MAKLKFLYFLFAALLLLAAGQLVETIFHRSPYSELELATVVSNSLQRELDRIGAEAAPLIRQHSDPELWKDKHFSFFLVDSVNVLQWTENNFLPDLLALQDPFSIKLIQVTQGDFLVLKWPLPGRPFLLCVLPLRKDYHIVNNYLAPEWNTAIFKTPLQVIDPNGKGEPVLLRDGQCVFKIAYPEHPSADNRNHLAALILVTASLLFVIAFIVGLGIWLHRQRRYALTFFWLSGSLAIMRILMVRSNFPNALSEFGLFDPHRFASSSINASMGDLLLNSLVVLALCIYLFLNYPRLHIVRAVLHAPTRYRLVASTLSLTVCFLSILFPFLFFEIIYHNSSLSLEISDSVIIDGIRWVAFLSTLIGCVSGFLFIHIFFSLTLLWSRNHRRNFWIALAGAAAIFFSYFYLAQKDYWIPFEVGLAYFAALFLGNGMERFGRFTFKTFLYLLVVILTLAFQGALSISKFSKERRIRDQFRFGNKFLVDQDVLGEYLLNESVRRISGDPFIQTRFLSPFLSKNSIRQKVREFYLNSYFDRYDVQVFLYDASGEPFPSQNPGNFASLIKNYQGETYKTAYSGIYFINTPTIEATKQYLVIVPVRRHQLSAGFIALSLRLKRVIPRNVYPELLVDNRFSHYFKSKDFSYAFYSKGRLTNSFGEFNYEKDFTRPLLGERMLYRQGVADGNFYHVGIEDRDGQAAIVTARSSPVFFLITNFSFLFVLGLVPILLLLLTAGAITWMTGSRLDYAARIQLYVYLAFFLPLLTVSITTLSLTKRSAEDQLRMEYGERSRALGEKMSAPLEEFISVPVNTRSSNKITELAKLADLDASVYSTSGQLMVSTQPLIFENRLTSTLINSQARNAIVRDKASSFVANEHIGKLQYNCSYVAIKSPETGNTLGILSIPFFGSAQSLEKIQINVLANILTVFVLVFILFSIISFIVANGLTFPLRFIARSIKKTTLTEKNQLILWNSNDEIGLLAHEYNRMILNLEQSRIELARIQKESAWREIAKQVAHEIKNPLTPMKLTLQQMEQSLNGPGLSPEKSRKAVETLLTQLEILNEIATSFGTFARMPAPEMEAIDIQSLLTNVVALHQHYAEGTVSLLPSTPSGVKVLGNEQLLSRVFGNIILNALQAGSESSKLMVNVSFSSQGDKCLIRIADNGRGIEPEFQDKVFLPHFSTKKSGSGLGLAIALQGIEQTGGRIWFETSLGKGTTFFVELVVVT